MVTNTFSADKKDGTWVLRRFEDRHLRPFLLKFVPSFVETYHLTLMTILWSTGLVVFGYLAAGNINWLWASSVMILGQYVTDFLDGAVGRMRNTGLIKWGYFMDHFSDYVFFIALMLGYVFIFPPETAVLIVIVGFVQIGFMISTFLSSAVANTLSISFLNIGPTEVRILWIIFNAFVVFFGLHWPVVLLPYFAAFMVIVLSLTVYSTQKKLWKLDMEIKSVGK